MSFDEKALLKDLASALNKSLTKIKKKQIDLLTSKLGLQAKTIKGKRQIIKKAKANNLNIAIFTTSKYLTPFMFKNSFRPKIPPFFGIATTQESGKFYSYRHPFKKASQTLPKQINGFEIVASITNDRGRKRNYSFISKKSILDLEALKFSTKLQSEFIEIFNKELEK